MDEKFWVDIGHVVAGVGDYTRAVGMVVLFFRQSQEAHKKGKLISEEEFAASFHEALIPAFAKRTPSGIQAKGAKTYFDWLDQKVSAGSAGGKKTAAKAVRDASGKFRQIKTDPSDHQPSSSSSSSSSYSNSPSPKVTATKARGATNTELNKRIWEAYATAYFIRYKTEPVRNASVNGKISQIGQRLGDEAPPVVSFYVSLPNSFYVRSLHPIGLCLKDAEALRTQWATGNVMTNRQAHQADDAGALAAQLSRLGEGK